MPTLNEIRDQVVHAWKFQKARTLAEKDAQDFSRKVAAAGYDLPKVPARKPYITTEPVPKMLPGMMLSMTQMEPPRPSELRQIPDAGETLRNALFSLEPNQVKVAPDQPKAVYYVMTLNQRFPVQMSDLYKPYGGPRFAIEREVENEAATNQIRAWMEHLRSQAGLDPNWVPPDEAKKNRES